MSWFSDRYEDYIEEAKRLQALEECAGPLYQQVWDRVLAIAAEATATGLTFTNSETAAERTLVMQQVQEQNVPTAQSGPFAAAAALDVAASAATSSARHPSGRTLTLTVDLAPQTRAILADSDGGCKKFPFTVDEKYKASLSYDNKEVKPEEAAETIMEYFLFHGQSPYAIHVNHVK